jgi:uncharacterized protein YbcI
MEPMETAERPNLRGGPLHLAISNAVVGVHRRCAGRGPTEAYAFSRGNVVVLVMANAMTKAEQTLVASGKLEIAQDLRRQLQQTMRPQLVGAVEQLTGCHVVAFMTDNHVDPDMLTELFILDRPLSLPPAMPADV